MTFHSRSVVEFGLFITRVSDTLLSGAPLEQSAELIRQQLSATAAAICIEGLSSGQDLVVLADQREAASHAPEAATSAVPSMASSRNRLAELLRSSQRISAEALSDCGSTRYTLWVFRNPCAPAFDQEEARVCEILTSQLRRSMELSARIGATEIERALYSSVMDRLYVGVVILDLNGRVVKSSAPANAVIAARDGLLIQAGKLRATAAKEDRELQQAIKAATQSVVAGEAPVSRALSLTKQSGSRNLGVIVQPIPYERRTGHATSATVAVYIRDSDVNTEVEGELVRQLFDLTPAEAAVARRLTAGLSLEDAASSLDISRNTARAHLRSIFSKSGISRQTELVRLVLNSAAVLGGRPRQVA